MQTGFIPGTARRIWFRRNKCTSKIWFRRNKCTSKNNRKCICVGRHNNMLNVKFKRWHHVFSWKDMEIICERKTSTRLLIGWVKCLSAIAISLNLNIYDMSFRPSVPEMKHNYY